MTKLINLDTALKILSEGGCVRFTWEKGQREIITKDGKKFPLDGRTYQPLVTRSGLKETRTGSTETKDLVIEWRFVDADESKRDLDYSKYPVATVRAGFRVCRLCGKEIRAGNNYHNGGGD